MGKPHYLERARIIANMAKSEGLTKDADMLYNVLCAKAKRAAEFCQYEQAAIAIYRFPRVIGQYDRNGDIVFAIIRNGAITTIQLRRSNQVNSAQRLRVDYISMGV